MRTLGTLALLLIVTVSLCCAAGPVDLASAEARALLARKPNTVILDVRTQEEYRQARLPGALLIPLADLERRVNEIPRDKPLLVYCAVGARSASASQFLSSKGFREIHHLSDGIVGWYKKGYPIER